MSDQPTESGQRQPVEPGRVERLLMSVWDPSAFLGALVGLSLAAMAGALLLTTGTGAPPPAPAPITGVWDDGPACIELWPDSSCRYVESLHIPMPIGDRVVTVRQDLDSRGRWTVGPDGPCLQLHGARETGRVAVAWTVDAHWNRAERGLSVTRSVSMAGTDDPAKRGSLAGSFILYNAASSPAAMAESDLLNHRIGR